MYKIKYSYNSGDSYTSLPNIEKTLEFTWTKLKIAEENLQRIKEHYSFYLLNNYYFNKCSKSEIKKKHKEAKSKDWYVKEYEFCLKLQTDNGNFVQFSAPWCGYFESLNWAEIKSTKKKLKRVEF